MISMMMKNVRIGFFLRFLFTFSVRPDTPNAKCKQANLRLPIFLFRQRPSRRRFTFPRQQHRHRDAELVRIE